MPKTLDEHEVPLVVDALRSHVEAIDGFLRDADEADEVDVVRQERRSCIDLINRLNA